MNKQEFVDELAEKTGINKNECKDVLEAAIETITETLVKREQISFIGFGSFSTSMRAARTAKVPGTDRVVEVPETTVAKFKAGKTLKELVSKG